MKFLKSLFGPKCYLCYMLISVWAIIQLTCMGAFFWVHSAALIEDIAGLHHGYDSDKKFYEDADHGYRTTAINCFICASLYVITLGLSCWLFFRKTHSGIKSGPNEDI